MFTQRSFLLHNDSFNPFIIVYYSSRVDRVEFIIVARPSTKELWIFADRYRSWDAFERKDL